MRGKGVCTFMCETHGENVSKVDVELEKRKKNKKEGLQLMVQAIP